MAARRSQAETPPQLKHRSTPSPPCGPGRATRRAATLESGESTSLTQPPTSPFGNGALAIVTRCPSSLLIDLRRIRGAPATRLSLGEAARSAGEAGFAAPSHPSL